MRRLLLALAALALPFSAQAQSTKVLNPTTGLPVFSTTNPAPVTIVSGTLTAGTVAIDQTTPGTTNGVTATGNVASGATDSGNGVKMACVYKSTPDSPTTGQRQDCLTGSRGSIRVEIMGSNSATGMSGISSNTDATAVGAAQYWGLGFVSDRTSVIRTLGDLNGTVVEPGLSSTFWYYSSGTSPILSNTTTAVTIKASCGASTRCYVDACQISSTALGASVPLAIRDGAGGAVIWALRPSTAGWDGREFRFSPPLRSTAATLLEIVTTTADTSGTFDVNCQGHTGS